MIKISRRGYTEHVRLLCITTARVYNLTKRDPYPKEGLLFNDILGITCTPYKDGFICIHTRETYEDRVKKEAGRNLNRCFFLVLRVIGLLLWSIHVNLLHNYL
jgi:hypothetical protein